MIVVLDTNVWISGLLWRGSPNSLIQLLKDPQLFSVVSSELLSELQMSLRNERKFSQQLAIHDETIESLSCVRLHMV